MIKRKIDSFSLSAKDTSGISCIGHIEVSGSHEDNISCASSVLGNRIRDVNITRLVKLNGSSLASNLFVHFSKGLTQSLGIILLFVQIKTSEYLCIFFGYILAHFITFIT